MHLAQAAREADTALVGLVMAGFAPGGLRIDIIMAEDLDYVLQCAAVRGRRPKRQGRGLGLGSGLGLGLRLGLGSRVVTTHTPSPTPCSAKTWAVRDVRSTE